MIVCNKDWILIVTVLSFGPVSTAKTCPTETTVIKVGGDLSTVIWKTRHSSIASIVISNPPCLDINNEVVVRFCLSGTWTQITTCHSIDKNTLCPIRFDEEDDMCVYVTPPQRFNESCPYPGESYKMKEYNNIWLPVKQTIPYGLLEYITPDDRYGLEYSTSDSSESSEEIFDFISKCVVKKYDEIEAVSCDEKFSRVCVYKFDHRLYRCPDACVSGGLGSNHCFCKKSTSDFMYNKCDIVDFPNFEYERRIMYKLVGSDVCIVDKSQVFNLYIAISKNKLHLKQLNEINCVICKVVTVPFEKVDLELKFNVKSYKLYLVVYSPVGLHKIDKKVQVYCFTDATSQLKKRTEVKLEYDSSIKNSSQRVYTIFQVSISEDGPGFYWCEAFLLPNMTVIQSNKVLAHKKLNYNEYSLRLHVRNLCKHSLVYCKMPNAEFFYDLSKTLFKNERFSFVENVRLFRIYDVNVEIETADILLHVAVKSKVGFEEEYNMARSNLQFLSNQNVTVISFSSSTHCLSESTFLPNRVLHWQLTPLGTVVTPSEICLTKNEIPLRRKCDGDFYVGAIWQNITNDCLTNHSVSLKTQFLHTFVVEDLPINLTANISNYIDDVSDLTILDVHYLNKILRRLSDSNLNDSKTFVSEIGNIINNLMKCNSTMLKASQTLLNVTDELLDIFENSLNSIIVDNDTILLVTDNVIIHMTKPYENNISGISLHENKYGGFSKFAIQELYSNTSVDNLKNESNMELAVFIPETLLDSLSSLANITVVTTIFYKDIFFNTETNANEIVASNVVSVSILEYDEYLTEPIPILFKSINGSNQKCAFWSYGLQSENYTGYWSTLGSDLRLLNASKYEVCYFSHLTNFALLVKSDQIVDENDLDRVTSLIEKYHDKNLGIISNFGCAISVLGIFGIFLTAILFKSWRVKVGTRILMQLCVAILLQIIFLNLAAVDIAKYTSRVFCTAVGVILHYFTIAEFSWMLVAAILQFHRFVTVIGPMPNRIILKASLVGWGLPLVPLILSCAIDIKSYSNAIEGICYPTGTTLYVAVFLPIVLIIFANLAVFIIVIRNVFKLKAESRGNNFKYQISLAILLFFLLGLPWIFGLLAELLQDTPFSYILLYLFCLTATLQGFVLFIFYVLLDKSTRILWCNKFKTYEVSKILKSSYEQNTS